MTESISKKLMDRATQEGKLPPPYLRLAIQVKDDEGKRKGVQGTGAHTVEFVSDKIVKGRDYKTKEERDEVEYTFIEDGQKKRYSVPVHNKKGELHHLVQKMSEVKHGEKIVLEYLKKEGSFEGYVDTRRTMEEQPKSFEARPGEADDDIPVINEKETVEADNYPEEGDEINVEDIPL